MGVAQLELCRGFLLERALPFKALMATSSPSRRTIRGYNPANCMREGNQTHAICTIRLSEKQPLRGAAKINNLDDNILARWQKQRPSIC